MTIGFIGLGRMGANMVRRLRQHKINVVAYNRTYEKTTALKRYGVIAAQTIDELLANLPKQKIVWLMLPAGKTTDEHIKEILPKLNKGDIIVDGANDFYGNAEKHAKLCARYGVEFFDAGVSGGIWGLQNGYTIMVGGPKASFKKIEPLCKALAPKNGYHLFGPAGSGHFVKSVHNIVEYVYLQGLAEGVELLKAFKHPLVITKATKVWEPASVVRSWLLELTTTALKRPDFNKIKPEINSVTIEELNETVKAVKGYAPAFNVATKIRRDTSKQFLLGKRTIAAVRREFGGHAISK